MFGRKAWLQKNRTLITAGACTAVLFGAVFLHYLQPGRCVVALVFCWVLASHSQDINDHKVEVLTALESTAKAGIEFRSGHMDACAQDAEIAAKAAAAVVKEIHATEAARKNEVTG